MALSFRKLTRPTVRRLKYGERINEHGIVAERLSSGDVRYSVNIMVDGRRIHRAIGKESEGVTREQAERTIESFRTKAREDRLDLPKGRKTHRTFKEAAEDYLKRLEEAGGKDLENKCRHLNVYLVPFFGKYRIDKITNFNVQQYVSQRLGDGAKQATINRELSTLSHLMNRMVEWKWIKADDRPRIVKGDEPRKSIVVMGDNEIRGLIEAAHADAEPRLWLFVAFGFNTAMRHSEIVAVRYDQIDFPLRRIFIPQAKAGEREQPITPALAEMLNAQRELEPDKEGWVFPCPEGSKHPHKLSMAKPFRRAVIAAGMNPDKVTPHVMRHTAITRLVKAGADLPTIQKVSGHKTPAMVLRYVHIHGSHIDQAIAAIDTSNVAPITPKLHRASSATTAEQMANGLTA